MLALAIVNSGPVAPAIALLLNRQAYSIGSVPSAATVNDVVSPSITRASTGCCVIVIGTCTVIAAESLTTVPASLLMLTRYDAASVAAKLSNTSSFLLAPAIAWPSLCHWYTSGSDPLATTDSFSAWPSSFVSPLGCVRITTGCTTVSFTSSLTNDPAGFFITTW